MICCIMIVCICKTYGGRYKSAARTHYGERGNRMHTTHQSQVIAVISMLKKETLIDSNPARESCHDRMMVEGRVGLLYPVLND